MNKEDFLVKISDVIEYDGELTYESILSDIEEWDSISIISTAAFLDSIGKKVPVDDIKNAKTVAQLANMAGIDE